MQNIARIRLPFPHPHLNPNQKHGRHWGLTSGMTKTAREDGYFAATEAYQRYPFEFDKKLPFRLHIGLYPPDSIKRDVDNIVAALKSYQDGVFDYLGCDDSEIRRKSATMHPPRRPGGMVYYILYQLGG